MYFKITNKEENHNGLQYQDGIVEDKLPFSHTGSCCSGGIYFSDEENIMNFSHYGVWIRQVEIPEDAKFVMDPEGDKWRANKLFFHPRKELYTVQTFKWLIENKINIKINNCLENSLNEAAMHNSLELVKFLTEQGANIKICSNTLYHSVSNKNLEMLSFLIDNGGYTGSLLTVAAEHNNLEIVKFLIKKGENINLQSNSGVLSGFATYGNVEAVKYLIEKGMNIHYQEELALRLSAAHGQAEMLLFLIDSGADINVGHYSPLVLSILYNHLNILKILLEKGVEFDKYKKFLIRYSVDLMDIDMIKFLVKKGCDIHVDNDILLRTAIKNNNEEVKNYINSLR